ncbi:molybdopterin synthase sulfur carrier subunit [Cellulomonas pakistanensis]|uniref:Molybdopterin synthase sulfur carrier subunit n=1 Tax=Cellulomonas pakistanensis TaxID=992287 RepID=A0A919P614_9CELL|nr:molybdopterin synthase sulfur carrier subunit [Cellulomonas pakistanensis]
MPVQVLLRYYAGAAAAAGLDQEPVAVPAGTTTGALVAEACARHGADLVRVAGACSVLVDGVLDPDRTRPLAAGTTVDLLPPFAGG